MIKLTTSEAVYQLKRYLSEYYTPRNREAHRMAIAALREREESMKVYAVLVQNFGTGDAVPKVSQTGYKTLEDAQAFCRSRAAEEITACRNGWVYWADCTRYEIVEVTI